MDTPSGFQTDGLIAEDIDAYLEAHPRWSQVLHPVDHRRSRPRMPRIASRATTSK